MSIVGGSIVGGSSGGGGGSVSPTTTKGDLIVRNSTVDQRLAVGPNSAWLVPDSAEASGVKWAPPLPDYYNQLFFQTDYVEGLTKSGMGNSSSSGSAGDNSSSFDGNIGSITIDTGSTSNGGVFLYGTSQSDFKLRTNVANRILVARARMYISGSGQMPTAGVQDYQYFMGFTSISSLADITAAGSSWGLYYSGASANWQIFKRVGSTNTFVDTGIAVTHSIANNLEFRIIGNATAGSISAQAYINGVAAGTDTVFDSTTLGWCASYIRKITGTTLRQIFIDANGYAIYGAR